MFVGAPEIFEYRNANGVPFNLVPVIASLRFYPMKWLYLSVGAGITIGGSKGYAQAKFGCTAAVGFFIPVGGKYFELTLKFISTGLTVKDAHARQGGTRRGSSKAAALGFSIGYFFGAG